MKMGAEKADKLYEELSDHSKVKQVLTDVRLCDTTRNTSLAMSLPGAFSSP